METRWPPRSPQEALLSSPSGRKKLRMYRNCTSPTPSPLKKAATASGMPCSQAAMADEDDEDDEETLQLRLEALEARLKLKKLQQKKLKKLQQKKLKIANATIDPCEGGNGSRAVSKYSSGIEHRDDYGLHGAEARQSAAIQVMVSPQKRMAAEGARSPGRILLGIDKGLKGRNVSLKRPPDSQPKKVSIRDDPFGSTLDRNACPRGISDISAEGQHGRSKTFSEKIAEIRQQDKDHKERSNRLRKQRSTGFGIKQCELDNFKNATSTIEPSESSFSENIKEGVRFSRDEVLRAVNKPTSGLLGRSNTVPGMRDSRHREKFPAAQSIPPNYPPEAVEKLKHEPSILRTRSTSRSPAEVKPSDASLSNDPLFEQFSSVQLSKRLIPHAFLTDTFADKHLSPIPSLLATIKSPTYELPEALENDFVVLGIIASKSSPLSHKDAHKSTTSSSASTSVTEATDSAMNARGKYMVFTLTDLKWSLDLYLFTTAYTRFWKLSPGTLIAVLNPSIMPPPPGKADTGRFSLVLNSSDDTILEIGTSRDLGWCKSVRKDGKPCGSWVDKRRTEFCEWHVDRVVESTRRGRMEVNGMSAPYAPGGKRGGRTGFWGGGRSGRKSKDAASGKEDGLVKEGPQWDRATSSHYFIAPSASRSGSGRSAASLLDAESFAQERGGNREERLRKRLAEQEREREIARRLGEGGNGIGSEYLKLRHGNKNPGSAIASGSNGDTLLPTNSRPADELKPGAEELGLKGTARDVKLGSIRKRLLGRENEGRERENNTKRLRTATVGIGMTERGRLGKDGRDRIEGDIDDDGDGKEEHDGRDEEEDDGLDII